MNICILGKYPPIEGGVSMETYWLSRGLAEAGHNVFVVTNAGEVERQHQMFLDPDDNQWLELACGKSGGSVEVFRVEAFSHRRMSHIPLANPFVSRLAGTAARVVRQHGCNVIFSYYLEPYGVAAHLAASWTGCPYVVKHAGSDTDQLMMVPGLAETYGEVFRKASAVITRRDLACRFLRMGISETRLALGMGFSLPALFSPNQPALDVTRQLEKAGNYMAYLPAILRRNDVLYDAALPTIGIYGKIGVTKGSYDLVAALAVLKSQGHRFNFLCMVGGVALPRFTAAIIEADLANDTWMLPFLPHWKVAGFIRSCTAVCFLERDFPIAIHGPGIPREVMACGTCLVVSGEIAEKQTHFFGFKSGDNCLVVKDPKNHQELAKALTAVITNPEEARRMGLAGVPVSKDDGSTVSWIDKYDHMLHSVAEGRVLNSFFQLSGDSAPASDLPSVTLQSLLPLTFELGGLCPSSLPGPAQAGTKTPLETAVEFCDDAVRHLDERPESPAVLRDVVLLERAVLMAVRMAGQDGFPFNHVDSLGDGSLSQPELLNRRPERNKHATAHGFAYDLRIFQQALKSDGSGLRNLPRHPSTILIVLWPNLAVKLVWISQNTLRLLELCDGILTVADISKKIAAGAQVTEAGFKVETKVCQAFMRLYTDNVVSLV